MKTSLFLTLLLITTGASVTKADEVQLPVITTPSQLNEGIQRGLTEAQIAELLPWAKDSKVFLADLLENVEELSTTDKVERLIDGIKKSVLESAPKNSELLMRYTLNRALAVSSILTNEMDPNAVGSVDVQSRVLILSIKLALKYYEADMDSLNNKAKTPFVSYGINYFDFL